MLPEPHRMQLVRLKTQREQRKVRQLSLKMEQPLVPKPQPPPLMLPEHQEMQQEHR